MRHGQLWDMTWPVQGNLDPLTLFAPLHEIERRVEDILRRAGGRPGHIFNLGHGILPTTPIEHVAATIDMVHKFSAEGIRQEVKAQAKRARSLELRLLASRRSRAGMNVRIQEPIAVLLMAMGGPDSLENVEPFLLDVRGGRPTPPELVEEIRERYRATGGKSPAVGITKDVAKKLEQRLNEGGGERYQVYVGLRHWHPFIRETYAELLCDAPEHIIGLCLAPQQSSLSTGRLSEKS